MGKMIKFKLFDSPSLSSRVYSRAEGRDVLSAPRAYPVGSFLKSSYMKKMLDILQCSSLYIDWI